LEVNGETVRNLFPGWHSILRGSRNSNVESRVNETYTRAAEKSSILARDETLIEEDTGDDTDSIKSDDIIRTTSPNQYKESAKSSPIGTTHTSKGYLLEVHAPLQGPTLVSAPFPGNRKDNFTD
jgi:hypothetical protein